MNILDKLRVLMKEGKIKRAVVFLNAHIEEYHAIVDKSFFISKNTSKLERW
jgi:hypothetical protein